MLALNEEKEKSIEALRKLSTMYTDPTSEVDPDAPNFHRYSLRGVSTTKNTLYLCKRAEPDLIDIDLDGDGPKSNRDQWWRIHFAASGPNPVTVEVRISSTTVTYADLEQKTTEEKVLEAAKTESKNILLVYASEKAMDFEVKPLPTSLQVCNVLGWYWCLISDVLIRTSLGLTTVFSIKSCETQMIQIPSSLHQVNANSMSDLMAQLKQLQKDIMALEAQLAMRWDWTGLHDKEITFPMAVPATKS